MNKHHKCSCQTTDTTIVPNTFIISYLHPLSKQEKQCFLDKIQGVIIDNIGPTRDLVEIYNDNWRHLEPSAIGDLIESISGHRVLAYPDLFLIIDNPTSVLIDSSSSISNSVFDICNIHANHFPFDPPDDPYFLEKKQWYLTHTRVNEVWKENRLLGSGITVAVIDSGVDMKHRDLQTTFLPGHNVINDSDQTSDSNGHGTMISGIIAATTNNKLGMASMAPGAKVRPIKSSIDKEHFLSSLIKSFEYIKTQLDTDPDYAEIINCSLGTFIFDVENSEKKLIEDFSNICLELAKYEVLIVFPAGNNGKSMEKFPDFPALLSNPKYKLPNVITVGGINKNNTPVSRSNYGSNYIQVAAPGIDILTTNIGNIWSNNRYVHDLSGTSFAAPIVCGILALMYQLIKNIPMSTGTKAEYLRDKLFESAIQTKETGPEEDKYWRHGVVDAYAAIQAIEKDPPPPFV